MPDLQLDMCAAPGSKTSQLIEQIAHGDGDDCGVVVANDTEPLRAYLLAHRVKSLGAPHAHTHTSHRRAQAVGETQQSGTVSDARSYHFIDQKYK